MIDVQGNLGWVVGVEPTTSRATVWRSATELYPPQCRNPFYTTASSWSRPRGLVGRRTNRMHLVRTLHPCWLSTGLLGPQARKLPVQPLALALCALRLLRTQHDRFKAVVALPAEVFKNRHNLCARLESVLVLIINVAKTGSIYFRAVRAATIFTKSSCPDPRGQFSASRKPAPASGRALVSG